MSETEPIDHGSEEISLLDRRTRAFRLHKLGQTLESIAQELGVSTTTIWKDIRWVQQHALACVRLEATFALSQAYSELEVLKREALDGWIRSQLPKTTRTRKRINGKGTDAEREEVTAQSERQAGDPRFLDQAKDCLWKQAVLLGMVDDAKQGRLRRSTPEDESLDDVVAIVEVTTRAEAAIVYGRRYCRIAVNQDTEETLSESSESESAG